jgi:hypothetical protein
MMAESVGRLLAEVAAWGAVVPVAVGLYGGSRRPAGERATLMWMAVALSINLWMGLSAGHGTRNADIAELGRAVYAITGLYAIGELSQRQPIRRWAYWLAGIYLILWAWRVVETDFALAFGPYSGPALYLALTLAAAGLVGSRLRQSSPLDLREFGMMIGIGTLVSYAPAVALDALSHLTFDTQRDALMVLWAVRGFFLVVGLVFFTLAFLWTIPHRSSSGSSASAA